jgi:YspA, cpYpsA-related SLOG family
MTRVLVCGGRSYGNHRLVNTVLDMLHADRNFTCFIHGAAKGADRLGFWWALNHQKGYPGFEILGFPADWDRYGRSAGAIRNSQMLKEGKPDLVVAFPGRHGTADMVEKARRHGVEVIQIHDPVVS